MKRTAVASDDRNLAPSPGRTFFVKGHLTAEECEVVQDVLMRTHLRRIVKIPGRRKNDLRLPDLLGGRLNADQISRYCAWNWRKASA